MDKAKPNWVINQSIRRKERYKSDSVYRQKKIDDAKKRYKNSPQLKEKNRQNTANYHKKMVAKDSLYVRKQHLKQKYNLSIEEYDLLFETQNGKCNICFLSTQELKTKYLVVDHDHETGRVRGLLCNHCNVAFGFVKEDVKVLESMISYAKRHTRV